MKFISIMMQKINNVIVYDILISIKPINKINWSFKNVLTTYAKSDSSMVN